jgi:hypothetical protein
MSTHTCSYYCERPECIKAQRDELRQKLEQAEKQEPWVKTYCGGKPNYTTPEQEPVAWHEPGAYGNVTTHKDWALANGWEPLYKEKNT